MENLNYSVVEIDHPNPSAIAFQSTEKDRVKNVKQFAWFLLLRVHQAVGSVARSVSSLWALTGAVKNRLTLPDSEDQENGDGIGGKGKLLLRFIKTILLLSLATLVFGSTAYWNGYGWRHFQKPNFHIPKTAQEIYVLWCSVRARYIAHPIQLFSNFCVVLFVLQSLDRTILCLGCLWIKLRKIQPRIHLRQDPFKSESDEEGCSCSSSLSPKHPMVLVQIPMCNEREVYQQSISAVCLLDWPKENLLIQVLDDSSDEKIQMLIRDEVSRWSQRGVNIIYRHRLVRTGYKAGNLKSAMNCDYVKEYQFVAIFDADFQPNPDFLKQTVAYFKGNTELGLVQTRWSFVNKDENLLTRLQNINLCFHFEVEQQVNSVFLSFFGFNGTAGVWRIKALEDSGGWLKRTTVEDMDIAVRAHLNGWKFIFLNHVKVLCEVPESYEAYRKQQHRWHSGPMHLFRLCIPAILKSKISIWKKSNLILLFFLLRKLILPFYSFVLFCVILPLTMFIPETELPIWVICYIPLFVSFLNILPAPESFPFIVPYLLFENTMSVTKFNAMVSGLFQFKTSYEWVVTKKAGRSSESDLLSMEEHDSKILTTHSLLHRGVSDSELIELNKSTEQKQVPVVEAVESSSSTTSTPVKKINQIYKRELSIALLLLTAAARSLLSAQGIHFYFLLFQGISFLVVGLDLIGEQLS